MSVAAPQKKNLGLAGSPTGQRQVWSLSCIKVRRWLCGMRKSSTEASQSASLRVLSSNRSKGLVIRVIRVCALVLPAIIADRGAARQDCLDSPLIAEGEHILSNIQEARLRFNVVTL